MSTELNLSFSEATVTAIKIIAESESDDFSKLVHAANLDKRNDFIGASFSGMKLDSTELTGFNFTDADFRNCSLKSTKFIDCQLTGALFDFPPDIRNRWHRDRDFFYRRSKS